MGGGRAEGRWEMPRRLRDGEGTSLEKRVLEASAGEMPSPELSARMAQALGISLPPTPPAPDGHAVKTGGHGAGEFAPGANAWKTWLAGGGIALAVAAGVVGVRSWRRHQSESQRDIVEIASRPANPRPEDVPPPSLEPAFVAPPAADRGVIRPLRSLGPSGARTTLAKELALIDGARALLDERKPHRALALLDKYRRSYSAGVFIPEATALRAEALVGLGRYKEARIIAASFESDFGRGPLADRVSQLASTIPKNAP